MGAANFKRAKESGVRSMISVTSEKALSRVSGKGSEKEAAADA